MQTTLLPTSAACCSMYNQATSFNDFRAHMCSQLGKAPATAPGELCTGGYSLELATGYSLVDRYGSRCRHRRVSLASMQRLGIRVRSCTELPNVYLPPGPPHRWARWQGDSVMCLVHVVSEMRSSCHLPPLRAASSKLASCPLLSVDVPTSPPPLPQPPTHAHPLLPQVLPGCLPSCAARGAAAASAGLCRHVWCGPV